MAAAVGARTFVGLTGAVFEVRIHAGQGDDSSTAAEVLALAAVYDGGYAQAFRNGIARTDAPGVSFCRLDDREIRGRDPVTRPDAVIVQDQTLLNDVDVLAGCTGDSFVLISSGRSLDQLGLRGLVSSLRHERQATVPADELAREHAGGAVSDAALLGGFGALTGQVSRLALERAIRARFAGADGEANAEAARAAHDWVESEMRSPLRSR